MIDINSSDNVQKNAGKRYKKSKYFAKAFQSKTPKSKYRYVSTVDFTQKESKKQQAFDMADTAEIVKSDISPALDKNNLENTVDILNAKINLSDKVSSIKNKFNINSNNNYIDVENENEDKENNESELVDITSINQFTDAEMKKGKKYKNSVQKNVVLVTTISVVMVVVLGVTGFCIYSNSKPEAKPTIATESTEPVEFTFSENIVISDIPVSGKTYDEAKELLDKNKERFIKPIKLMISIDGEITELNQNDFEYTYDIDKVLDKVKNDDIQSATEQKGIFSSETQPAIKEYKITVEPIVESIAKKVEEIADNAYKKPVNACVSEFSPYSEQRFTYKEAVAGREIDSDDLNNRISDALSSGLEQVAINAVTTPISADIQIDDVKNNIVKLATYQTISYNTANGTSNMGVALSACNGSIIEPDGEWSFNDCTGDSNLESNGYKAAHVISEGEIIDGIGGGICQASSTIYNAAIRANLDFDERYCHQYASTYVPTGLDATIDYPNLDLVIYNPTDYQMFLECKLEGSTLTATFWGYKSSSYDYIKTENELGYCGSTHYDVSAWRVYYKNDEEIDREELSNSKYDNKNGVIFHDAANDSGAVFDGRE